MFVGLGVLGLPYSPTVRAMIPQVVPAERLFAANARLEGVMEAMYLLGPAVAGVTIAAFGPLTGLGIDAATFLAAAFVMATLSALPRPSPGPAASYVAAMWHGGRVMWRSAVLRPLALLAVVVQVTDAAFIVLSVPLVRSVLHGTTRGVAFWKPRSPWGSSSARPGSTSPAGAFFAGCAGHWCCSSAWPPGSSRWCRCWHGPS